MSILNIVEYENNLSDNHLGDIVVIQNIEFDDSSPVYTNRFSYRTGSIRVAATQNCWLKFTASDDVVSGENDGILLFSSNPQRFRVEPGYKISVLEGDPSAGTGGGDVDLSDAYQTEHTGDWIIEQAEKASTALQPLITGYSETGVTLAFVPQASGANTIPLDGRQYYLVVTGDCTIAIGDKPTAPACGNAVLHVLIDTATPPAIALPAGMIWADSTIVPIATANGARTRLLLSTDPWGGVHIDVDSRGVPL